MTSVREAARYFRLTEAWLGRLVALIESHPIATNLTPDTPLARREPGESYQSWLKKDYE